MSMHWQHFSSSPASQQQTHKLARLSPYSKHPTATDPSQNPVLPRHHAGLQMDNQQIFHQPRLVRERHRRHSATLLHGVCPQLLCLGWRSHRNCGQRVFTFCSLILGRQGANHLAQSRDFNISDASTDTTTTAVIAGAAITDGGLGSVLLSILSAEASAFSPTQVSSTAPPSVERIPGPPTSTPSTASNPVSSTSSTSTGTPSSPLSSPVVSASTTMTSMNFTSPVSTSIAPLNSDKHNTIP